MSSRNYWVTTFKGNAWEKFLNRKWSDLQENDEVIAGFPNSSRKRVQQQMKIGDYLLCYQAGESCWIGLLEVVEKPFYLDKSPLEANDRIWPDDKELEFRNRVKVRILVRLTPETGIPISNLRNYLSIYKDHQNHYWTGFLRANPTKWSKMDGIIVEEALRGIKTYPSYWIFCANPRNYRIVDAVQDLEEDSWTLQRGNVRAGDRAIIWKAKGNDQHRGIIALAEILSNPTRSGEPNIDYWVDKHVPNEPVDRVQVRYILLPTLPLWEDEASNPVLSELSASRATGGTIFHMTPNQWEAIMAALGGWPSQSAEIEDIKLVIDVFAGRTTGQRFRTNAAERKAIEKHAMQRAEIYFQKQEWIVTDTSATHPFDLLCVRDTGEELHVEVKGTTSDGKQILLTANEVMHARNHYPQTALFVVSNIQIERTSPENIQAIGGDDKLFEPWDIDEGVLTSLAFSYICPSSV